MENQVREHVETALRALNRIRWARTTRTELSRETVETLATEAARDIEQALAEADALDVEVGEELQAQAALNLECA